VVNRGPDKYPWHLHGHPVLILSKAGTLSPGSRRVIESELQRLSRRVPSLGPADLDVIEAALEDLTECLIRHRLRNAPRDTVI
jgi:FtsP/CotA-like multicopper oxidase with cupredoxin domain